MDINMNEQPGFAAGGPGDAFGPCSQASLPKVLQTACTGYPHRMLDRPRSAGAPQPRSATVGMQSTETRRKCRIDTDAPAAGRLPLRHQLRRSRSWERLVCCRSAPEAWRRRAGWRPLAALSAPPRHADIVPQGPACRTWVSAQCFLPLALGAVQMHTPHLITRKGRHVA